MKAKVVFELFIGISWKLSDLFDLKLSWTCHFFQKILVTQVSARKRFDHSALKIFNLFLYWTWTFNLSTMKTCNSFFKKSFYESSINSMLQYKKQRFLFSPLVIYFLTRSLMIHHKVCNTYYTKPISRTTSKLSTEK